jgi:8-hydroxy-5-deazaflavin:NADPH oxidoreductase
MRIGVIGPGRIGGNAARQALKAGHEVALSFSRDPARLAALAEELGPGASAATPAEVVESSEIVVFAVPWDAIDDALAQAGSLDGRIVIDTTNQYGQVAMPAPGQTAAQVNAARMPGARYTKSFNTLTAAFQVEAADRTGDDRVVQWICGDDAEAKRVVSDLIAAMGYQPVDLGATADCEVMEAPRRPGSVYGQEYRLPDARAVVEAVKAGEPIPPTPSY